MKTLRPILALASSALFVSALCLSLKASESSPGKSVEESLVLLQEGNARYVAGKSQRPNQDAERRVSTAKGQTPFVTILSCSDSREPPEIIFDRGIGDLFIIRVAGNVAGTSEMATAEYGAGHLHTRLLLVLGHTKCGAVTAAVKKADVHGSLPALLAHIDPACERAKASGAADQVDRAIEENVWETIYSLYVGSAELRELSREGHLKIVGAVYNIESGTVRWLGSHPQEKSLLAIPSPVVIPAPGAEAPKPEAPAHH